MSDSVLALKEVFDYLNIMTYPIKLSAESNEAIQFFDGKTYKKNGSTHDLIDSILGTSPILPSMICFSREAKGAVYTGYKSRNTIFPILIYYAEDVQKTMEYPEFEKYYFKTFPPSKKQIMTRVLVNWVTFAEAQEQVKVQPKKTLVFLYANWRVSATMMNLTTINNPKIADYLNDKFYTIDLNTQTKDVIEVLGIKYINENQSHGFHQLPIAMLDGKMMLPSILILDENMKVLDKIQMYMTPETIEPLLHYFGDDEYKSTSWENYKAKFKSKLND